MTSHQLLSIRKNRNMTREEFASMLGSCTSSAVNHWENGKTPVPDWVEEKLFRTTEITLQIDDLSRLLDIAREEGIPFNALLTQSIREYIARRPAGPPQESGK
jgi:transcriptional regulator with XRE-family HTH domain